MSPKQPLVVLDLWVKKLTVKVALRIKTSQLENRIAHLKRRIFHKLGQNLSNNKGGEALNKIYSTLNEATGRVGTKTRYILDISIAV